MVCLRALQLFKDMKLHERKRQIVEHKFKGRETEYAREKYQAKKEKKNEKSGFVTKDTFQLVFGFSCPTIQAKTYYKEYNSKGSINGVRQV